MKQGIALAIASSSLFAVLYYYSTVLPPVTGTQIFAWRVLLAVPFLAVLISRGRAWGEVARCAQRARTQWRYGGALLVSAALLGVQLWLFTWAPLHRKALDVSLGYFLMPLVMVLVGRCFYGERLSRAQWLAVAAAAVGVVHEVLRLGTFSWATALVMFGYPPYFMLRRKIRLGSLAGLWSDMLLLTPAALFVIATQQPSLWAQLVAAPRLLVLIPLLGVLSSVALTCYLSASRMLPLALFGLLGYVEPVLLFWVAFLLLGEPVAASAWLTYIPIWAAVLLLAGEGGLLWLKEARHRPA